MILEFQILISSNANVRNIAAAECSICVPEEFLTFSRFSLSGLAIEACSSTVSVKIFSGGQNREFRFPEIFFIARYYHIKPVV